MIAPAEKKARETNTIGLRPKAYSGLHSALLLEGSLGALAHASHNEYRETLFEVHRKEGVKAYLDMRDGPFQPEPMGPRSTKGRAARGKN